MLLLIGLALASTYTDTIGDHDRDGDSDGKAGLCGAPAAPGALTVSVAMGLVRRRRRSA